MFVALECGTYACLSYRVGQVSRVSFCVAIVFSLKGAKPAAERMSLILGPEQAYGHRDESLIKKVPRDHVNAPGELEVGLKLRGRDGSKIMPITVVGFDNETVTLDANNPLAGTTLSVDIVIVEVREAIDAELKSGRVQDMETIYEKERMESVVVDFKL